MGQQAVTFPVAKRAALVRLRRSLFDPVLPGACACASLALLHAMLLVAAEAKTVAQKPSLLCISDHMLVDGFMRNPDSEFMVEAPGDLFWAPAKPQLLLHEIA